MHGGRGDQRVGEMECDSFASPRAAQFTSKLRNFAMNGQTLKGSQQLPGGLALLRPHSSVNFGYVDGGDGKSVTLQGEPLKQVAAMATPPQEINQDAGVGQNPQCLPRFFGDAILASLPARSEATQAEASLPIS